MKPHYKEILFAGTFVIVALIVWYAIDVFFLAFATILLAILLHAIGVGAKKVLHLPYVISLIIGVIFILGLFALVFWLYSPLIAQQFQLLLNQLPNSVAIIRKALAPYLSKHILSHFTLQEELNMASQAFFSKVVSIFSTTIGAIVSFVIFIIVGFYLATFPQRYLKGALFILPTLHREEIWDILVKICRSLRYWLLGKVLSMFVIGVLTFLGLWLLNIPLAFILGLLIGLMTFIPYVGAILASIPAVLIAFTEGPLTALYVIILYLGIHIAEGYFITPLIEQKAVSIPPALTIMSQLLLLVLTGALGLLLATPLLVVVIAIIINVKQLN